MAKLGSIKYQVQNLINSINGIGVSKLAQRQISDIKSIESGHKISNLVHSFKSIENLKNDLCNLANFAKENFAIKDIKKININHISDWIKSKNITYNTASNYLSGLNKVENYFNFTREQIKDLRADLKNQLKNKPKVTRAYKRLDQIELRPHLQAAFELQRDYGLRINASTHINLDKQLVGNVLFYSEKGGKQSSKELNPDLILKLKEFANNSKYQVCKRTFSRELKRKIESTGQKFNGAHGIRHTYAQAMLKISSKDEVSQAMGHTRPNITNAYLR